MSNEGAKSLHEKMNGLWLLMYQNISTARFIIVPDGFENALMPIIKFNVEPGSTILSDQYTGYNRLAEESFRHEQVRHRCNYVNLTTGFHTQAIWRVWLDAKAAIRRNCRAMKREACNQSLLVEYC